MDGVMKQYKFLTGSVVIDWDKLPAPILVNGITCKTLPDVRLALRGVASNGNS